MVAAHLAAATYNNITTAPPHPFLRNKTPANRQRRQNKTAERNPCRCSLFINLANNTRFCPTKATVSSLAAGTVEALSAASAANVTCRLSDFSQTTLKEYLANPKAYLTSIPAAPPPKLLAASASRRRPRGGGARLGAGAIAGIVIAALAAVGGVAALAWFVGRPRLQEKRATGFFKTRELDIPLPGSGAGAPPPLSGGGAAGAGAQAQAMEAGWTRTI